MVFSRTDYPWP